MNARTRSRKAVSIGSNQSAKSGPASSASGCRASRFVVGLAMAWSPARRANAGIDRVGQPGDYATPDSNQPRDATARARGWHRRTEDAVVARLRELARALPDHKVTERLDAEGLRPRTGKAWTYARAHSIRRQHGIATACPPHTREAAGRADRLLISQ